MYSISARSKKKKNTIFSPLFWLSSVQWFRISDWSHQIPYTGFSLLFIHSTWLWMSFCEIGISLARSLTTNFRRLAQISEDKSCIKILDFAIHHLWTNYSRAWMCSMLMQRISLLVALTVSVTVWWQMLNSWRNVHRPDNRLVFVSSGVVWRLHCIAYRPIYLASCTSTTRWPCTDSVKSN